ncbi:hypothetical protein OQA88_12667 [Cercophora sp. LCS_1]
MPANTLIPKYPWALSPLIIAAPMRLITGPHLALSVARAGGIGFVGPGQTLADLKTATSLHFESPLPSYTSPKLPLGVAFQMHADSLPDAATAISTHPPIAAWLFAPRNGQSETDTWISTLRKTSPGIQIWLQIGTLTEALSAAKSGHPPDVLVIQGAEAGGHGRAHDGVGFITLLPEVDDALGGKIPLVAAGGIIDGRGVVAALGVGAKGAAMGTRFLASEEARVKEGYQQDVVRTQDGAKNTVRTGLYNRLRGSEFPSEWEPRGVANKSWEEWKSGVNFEELKRKHDEAVKEGKGWGEDGRTATYAGAGIGLVRRVEAAGRIVEETRAEAKNIMKRLREM